MSKKRNRKEKLNYKVIKKTCMFCGNNKAFLTKEKIICTKCRREKND